MYKRQVYGILRLINFAHGDVFMVAGLVMVYATASLPIYVSIVLVVVVTVAIGVIIEKVAYKPLRSAPRMSVMISAIGVSYLLQNCALYFTGGLPQIYHTIPFLSEQVQIGSATTKTVSYTHLDVYKRQLLFRERTGEIGDLGNTGGKRTCKN